MYRQTKQFVSYDNPESARQKVEYINRNVLGGAMFWELSGDANDFNGRSLVRAVKDGLAGGLEYRQNELGYPGSSQFCTSCMNPLAGDPLIATQSTRTCGPACQASNLVTSTSPHHPHQLR